MYPVSLEYQEKIKENNRLLEAKIQIQHSKGVLDITDKELAQGTLIYTESSQSGEEFTIGGTVASDIKFAILNKPEYENIQFMGATVFVSIGLQIKEGMDAHFIQPSQPSKMPGFEEKWEYVPLGRFNIDYDPRQRNTIELKAIDNMINLDKPYSLSKLSYPATLYQIYVDICNVADVNIGTTNFINKNYIVNKRPSGDLSLRDVLGYVAELTGSFARMNRNGALELKWYTPTGLILDPSNRFDFKPSDDLVQIKGIMGTVEDTTYLAGSEDYAIDLTENPLLQGGHETVLPNIFNKVKDTVFTPYESSWQGNMAIQAGDIITQIDRDGKVYNTLVTNSNYKYRGASKLAAKGLPEISKGFKGSTNRKIAEIKRKVEEEVGDKITDLEQAILEATELITGELGGYVLKRENELLIMDNPDPAKAQKVWRWNLAGLGYSNSGIDGPYGLAMTMNGQINANFVTTGLLSANMVKTGLLQSIDGSTWINMDNGNFNFKNALKWENGQLIIQSPSIPPPVDVTGINQDINNIKNLVPGALVGGITTLNNERVRVSHGSGQYSEIRANGFVRQFPYGEAYYVNDLYVTDIIRRITVTNPSAVAVELPARFRGRGANTKIILALNGMRPFIRHPDVSNYTYNFQTILEVESSNFNLTNPIIMVNAYVQQDKNTGIDYTGLNFVLMAISS